MFQVCKQGGEERNGDKDVLRKRSFTILFTPDRLLLRRGKPGVLFISVSKDR